MRNRGVMPSPDHAAKRPATALIRAFLDMPSEDRFQTVMEDPSTLDALLIEADALVAALAQAEHERDEARRNERHMRNLHDWRIRDLQDVRADRDFLRNRAERAEQQRDQATKWLRLTLAQIGHKPWCACDICKPARDVLANIEKGGR